MFESFDEADLLALIEDALEPEKATALRARLAENPRALAAVEAMRSDRALLQADPEPVLPADLLAELEPVMARPMLMPPAPASGDWRRKYRRRRSPLKLAVAASVALLGLAGLWAGVTAVTTMLGDFSHSSMLAEADRSPAPAAPPTAAGPEEAFVGAEPPPTATAESKQRRPAPGRRLFEDDPPFEMAQLLLFVETPDVEAVEATLQGALDGRDNALVRNFSYAEAEYLATELRIEEGGRLDRLDEVVEAWAAEQDAPRPRRRNGNANDRRDRDAVQDLARRLQELRRAEDAVARSRQLVGSKKSAPSYERQLEFSELGATHTLSIPAGRLNEVLATLDEGYTTRLTVVRDGAFADAATPSQQLRDYITARRTADHLDPETLVHVPIVIE